MGTTEDKRIVGILSRKLPRRNVLANLCADVLYATLFKVQTACRVFDGSM